MDARPKPDSKAPHLGPVIPFRPGEIPAEPGWYVVENDSLTRYVVQVIPCRGGLFVFETEAVETFPLEGYDAVFLARLSLDGIETSQV